MEISFNLGTHSIIIPETITSLWIVTILLSIFAIYVNKKVKKAKAEEVPSKFLNVIELLVETINGMVRDTMGERNMKFAPFIFFLMVFLSVSNLFGLTGLVAPTSDYSVTLSLALIVFTMVQYFGIKSNGGFGYVKGFFQPYILLSPLNIIGELANPVSLSFRLFGNIMSGGLILTLVYSALGYFAPLVTPFLHGYFDLFSGLLQAFIFTMLTMVFISGATE